MQGGDVVLNITALEGLRAAPSQVWGSVRLVPLIRARPAEDLRITRRAYGAVSGVVGVDGRLDGPRKGRASTAYISYIPHGLVMRFGRGGEAVAAAETALREGDADGNSLGRCVKVLHRMVKREGPDQLRLLPLHLALEGFLAQHFGGPDVAWEEYSRQALRDGLSPRIERGIPGEILPDLADALRLFEVHEGQCGVLVYVADALASAFVVAHPDDYRALHGSLVQDLYGELLLQYGLLGQALAEHRVTLDGAGVRSAEDLRRALAAARAEWASFDLVMAAGLLGRPVRARRRRRAGAFTLYSFMTGEPREYATPEGEEHIGEAMLRADGELMYLKTFRLSRDQRRRAWLLDRLAAHGWHLGRAAEAVGISREHLIVALDRAGLGYLLKPEVLAAAR